MIAQLAILPLLAVPVLGDILTNPAPQIFFPIPDDQLHPEWTDRQGALTANYEQDAGGCGGVCVLTPEVMEGPFYLDYHLDRSNITEDISGVPLTLTLSLYQISSHLSDESLAQTTCEPLSNAWIDIWSCDNQGIYSGYGKAAEQPGGDRPPGPPPPPGGPGKHPKGGPHPPSGPGGPGGHAEPTTNSTFLRGIQKTDPFGKVTFSTIYPGWYPGRTVHLHLKVHPPSWSTSNPSPASLESRALGILSPSESLNSTHTHTTQLFFPQGINDKIAQHPSYSSNNARRVRNDQDMLYIDMNGASVLEVSYEGDRVAAEGAIGIDKWW